MCMTDFVGRRQAPKPVRQRGFTLVELIIFIVVVSVGMAGILLVMNTSIKSSADPMVRKQMVAVAESLLEEILLKDYCDPDTVDRTTTPPTCPARIASDKEASRNLYDDVDDYSGYNTTSGIVDAVGSAAPLLTQYNISAVTVTLVAAADSAALNAVSAKKITVTVTHGSDTLSLTGYRANY